MNTEVNSIFRREGFIPVKHLNVPLQEALQRPDSKSDSTIMPEPSQNFKNPSTKTEAGANRVYSSELTINDLEEMTASLSRSNSIQVYLSAGPRC